MFGYRSYFASRLLASSLLLSMLLVFGAPAAAEDNNCEACHSQDIFFTQNRHLYEYYQDWLTSPHREVGVTCDQCHGGNPGAMDKQKAHEGVLRASNPRSRVSSKNQPATCRTCHGRLVEQFTESRHYKALVSNDIAPDCSTCHRAMNRKPYYRDILENTCRTCHSDLSSGEERPVVEQAREILHRLNISKGYLGWTTLYYQEREWPGDTKQQLSALRQAYHDILTTGHNFDLERSEKASVELLAELKIVFRQAWKEREAD